MLTPVNATGGSTISLGPGGALVIDLGLSGADLRAGINDPRTSATADRFRGLNQLNYDIQALETNATATLGTFEIFLLVNTTLNGGGTPGDGTNDIISADGSVLALLDAVSLANSSSTRALINLNQTSADTFCDAECDAVPGALPTSPNTSVYEGLFESVADTHRSCSPWSFPTGRGSGCRSKTIRTFARPTSLWRDGSPSSRPDQVFDVECEQIRSRSEGSIEREPR